MSVFDSVHSSERDSSALQAIATMASFVFFGVAWAVIAEAGISAAEEDALAPATASSYSRSDESIDHTTDDARPRAEVKTLTRLRR